MGMITEYVRLRPHELTELRRLLAENPRKAAGYAGDLRLGDLDEEVSSRGMDTDKAWDGLQYLLAKAGSPVDIIGGGEPMTEYEWGYDCPRLLSSDEVAQAARFLGATSFSALAKHYKPAKMAAAEIYPSIWEEEWTLSYLESHYNALVKLFRAAAADYEPILVWMD